MINRLVIAAAVLILFPIHPAFSLVYRESDDLFVYYPESEDRIATRLIEIFPSIRDFLEKQGIPLKYPLYVVLDNKLDRPGTDHCRLLAGAARVLESQRHLSGCRKKARKRPLWISNQKKGRTFV